MLCWWFVYFRRETIIAYDLSVRFTVVLFHGWMDNVECKLPLAMSTSGFAVRTSVKRFCFCVYFRI